MMLKKKGMTDIKRKRDEENGGVFGYAFCVPVITILFGCAPCMYYLTLACLDGVCFGLSRCLSLHCICTWCSYPCLSHQNEKTVTPKNTPPP